MQQSKVHSARVQFEPVFLFCDTTKAIPLRSTNFLWEIHEPDVNTRKYIRSHAQVFEHLVQFDQKIFSIFLKVITK